MQRGSFAPFLFFSLLLHAFLLVFFSTLQLPSMKPPTERLLTIKLLPPSSQPTPPVIAKVEPPPVIIPPPAKQQQVEKLKPLVEKPRPVEQAKPQEPKPQEKLPEQIVNPPDQVNDQIPEKTRLLSDRNSATKEETVARGMPRATPARKDQPPVRENATKEEQKPPIQQAKKEQKPLSPTKKPIEKLEGELTSPKRPVPGDQEEMKTSATQMAMKPSVTLPSSKPDLEKKLEKLIDEESLAKHSFPTPTTAETAKRAPKLFARPEELLSQGWISDEGKDREEKEKHQPPQGRDIIAMAPPPAENLFALPDPIGTPDVLPDIRKGNITFLNAKANRFAPFVRRVALRVFQHLIIHQRRNLHINDVVAAHDFSTIEAKIDTRGNLKKLLIQTRSGSYAVDEALLRACENGAWDENPPAEAIAEDGLIHFIFRSDINAQYDDLGLRSILTTLQVGLV